MRGGSMDGMTWEERMAVRAKERALAGQTVAAAEQIAMEAAEDETMRITSLVLRQRFLESRPDLPLEYRMAIIEAPTKVVGAVNDMQDPSWYPYDPADYAWSEDELWAEGKCRECFIARPPGLIRAMRFGWSLDIACDPRCDHEHHKGGVCIG